jgi:hypothetical protein
MATMIRILQPVGDWPAGVIIAVEERRADRLARQGYAERVPDPPVTPKRRGKDDTDGRAESHPRV